MTQGFNPWTEFVNGIEHLDPVVTPDEEISCDTVHPMVKQAMEAMYKAGEAPVSDLEGQIMQCAATEIFGGVSAALNMIDAGNPDLDVPAVYIVDSEFLTDLVFNSMVIGGNVLKIVLDKWQEQHDSHHS